MFYSQQQQLSIGLSSIARNLYGWSANTVARMAADKLTVTRSLTKRQQVAAGSPLKTWPPRGAHSLYVCSCEASKNLQLTAAR